MDAGLNVDTSEDVFGYSSPGQCRTQVWNRFPPSLSVGASQPGRHVGEQLLFSAASLSSVSGDSDNKGLLSIR